jgi:hypothetical protein
MSEEQESVKEKAVELPEVRVYFDGQNNLKMDLKNTNVYQVIGMLRASLRRLESGVGLGKAVAKPQPGPAPEGEAPKS